MPTTEPPINKTGVALSLIDALRQMYGLNRKRARILVRLSRSAETTYAAKLLDMVKRVNGILNDTVIPRLDDIWKADNWSDMVMAVMATARSSAIGAQMATPIIATAWAREVQLAATNRWEQTLKNAFGVDVQSLIAAQPQNQIQSAVSAAVSRNVRLIRSIPEQYLDKVEDIITQARQNKITTAAAAKQIREVYPVSKRRAKLIARDQTNKLAEAVNREQQELAGVTSYFWRGKLDDRERKLHLQREGKLFRWDKPPSDGHPGEPVCCFTGSTKVNLAHGANKLWRRYYTGPLVSIKFSDGTLLEATPNHPILTMRGWLPINDLQQGDNVIQATGDGISVSKPHHTNFETTFDNLFEAVSCVSPREASPGSKLDFHGDGTEGNIDVVNIDRLLSDRIHALSLQRVKEFSLSGAYVSGKSSLSIDSHSSLRFLRDLSSPRGIMSASCQFAPFRARHFGVSDQHCFRARSNRNGVVSHDALNYAPGDLVLLTESLDADALGIIGHNFLYRQIINAIMRLAILWPISNDAPSAESLADAISATPQAQRYFFNGHPLFKKGICVVEKTVREFSGHVYNIQTETGYYLANGVVAHNCRCHAQPNLEEVAINDALQAFRHNRNRRRISSVGSGRRFRCGA